MLEMGMFETKTHLSDLVSRVEKGEEIIITRRGKRVARVVPYADVPSDEQRVRVRKAIARMRKLRKGNKLNRRPGESLRDLAHEGHRY